MTGTLKTLYLKWFSRPQADRELYRAVLRGNVRSIVELGLGTATRAQRLIELALKFAPPEQVLYTGIDGFEMRTLSKTVASGDAAGPETVGAGLTLKGAYKQLKATGAQVRLLPGDPFSALSRGANTLLGTDLLIISADQHGEALERTWFYIPRMLHPESLVYLQEPATDQPGPFRRLTVAEVQQRAPARAPGRQAA